MSTSQVVSELVVCEEALSTTSFSADGSDSFQVPGVKGLIDAADTELLVFPAGGVLVDVLSLNMEKSKSNRPSKERHQSILLELVIKDGSI